MQRSVAYILSFAAAVCLVCGILVSSSAVSLKDLQDQNAELERQTNVLLAAGLAQATDRLDSDEVERRFEAVKPLLIELETGRDVTGPDSATYDQQRAKLNPELSHEAPANNAGIKRLPNNALAYRVIDASGETTLFVLPIEGLGLWSTLYGFVAIDADLNTIRGLTFYDHGETPGLGGEVDNPNWKSLWPGRHAFDDSGQVALSVIKGRAGPAASDPLRVDGLSGATITSRGVTNMLHFWLGKDGFGPYLETVRQGGEAVRQGGETVRQGGEAVQETEEGA